MALTVHGLGDEIQRSIKEQFEGVFGALLNGYGHGIDLTVHGNVFPNVSMAFSHDMPDNATNILRQLDFFDLFPVKFTFRKKELELMAGSNLSRR